MVWCCRAPTFVAGGVGSFPTHPQRERERDDYDRGYGDRRGGYGSMADMNANANGMAAASVLGTSGQAQPDYGSFEEAEGA